MRRRSLFAALLAIGVAASGLPAAAAVGVVNVSMRATSQSEAAVAVSPLNPADVVIATNRESGYGIFVAVSHDAGATWSRSVLGNNDGFGRACCDPTITWDAYGNLFLSWLGYTRSSYPTVMPILLSTDAGDSWTVLTKVDPPRSQARSGTSAYRRYARQEEDVRGPGFVDQPTIATGPHALWVVWSLDDQVVQAVGARVRGLGDVADFRGIEQVRRGRRCRFGDVAIGPHGVVALVCQRDMDGAGPVRSELLLSIDADGLGPGGFTPPVISATTKVSTFEPIPAQHKRTIDAEAGLGWIMTGAFRGRLVLLFTDERPDQSNDTNVHTKVSDDNGATWSDRAAVTAAPNSQFLPRLAVDPTTGHLAAGWHDASLDVGSGAYDTDGVPNTDAMYAMSFSADGLTWSAPQMVSQGASNAEASHNFVEYGDYTGLGFVAGVAHPAWADNSDSTGDNPDGTLRAFDVYSAAVAEF